MSFTDAEFLHRTLTRSILGILFPVSQMQNFFILARCSRFWVFCVQFSDAQFLHIKLDAVDIRYQFPDAEFLHLSLMQSILSILYPVSQMQNFCILA